MDISEELVRMGFDSFGPDPYPDGTYRTLWIKPIEREDLCDEIGFVIVTKGDILMSAGDVDVNKDISSITKDDINLWISVAIGDDY